MALWLLEPVADTDDPRWQTRQQWARVIVRAASPAFARIAAESLDTNDRALQQGQEDPHLGSGFKDEKLYRVTPFAGADDGADGPDQIIEAIKRN